MKPRYVHIGSFNIEHFGRADDSPNNVFAIAEHIEMSGVSVLALQELYVTDMEGDNRRNSLLDKVAALMSDHTGQDWRYEIFANRDPGDRAQLCGVLWSETRVEREGEAFRIPVEHRAEEEGQTLSLWDRAPHAVKFRARPGQDDDVQLTDFVIVPLHMKSNVGHRHWTMRTRYHEARTLMEKLDDVRARFAQEVDIVLLGDTNCKKRGEDAIQAFIAAGFEDLNEDDTPTYYSGTDAPFDRIFVPRDRRAFLFTRQYILRSASPLSHDRYISDHYMVKASIVVRRDDDFELVLATARTG